jgi:hypothetical protein
MHFVKLFLDEVWKPFDSAERPEEQWPEITETIERLRPSPPRRYWLSSSRR